MTSYCFTLTGILKILTLVIGGVSFGLGAYAYDETVVQEEFFVRTVQAALILSVIYFAIHLTVPGRLVTSDINRAVDIAFHITTAVTLLVAGSLVIYSAVDNERTYCDLIYSVHPHLFCQFYGLKLAAGIVSIFNGVVYWITAATVFLTHPDLPDKGTNHQRRNLNPISFLPERETDRTYASEGPRTFYYGTK